MKGRENERKEGRKKRKEGKERKGKEKKGYPIRRRGSAGATPKGRVWGTSNVDNGRRRRGDAKDES